jgi:hypothetical protein
MVASHEGSSASTHRWPTVNRSDVAGIAGLTETVVARVAIAIPVSFALVADGHLTDKAVLMVPTTGLDLPASLGVKHDGVAGSEDLPNPVSVSELVEVLFHDRGPRQGRHHRLGERRDTVGTTNCPGFDDPGDGRSRLTTARHARSTRE